MLVHLSDEKVLDPASSVGSENMINEPDMMICILNGFISHIVDTLQSNKDYTLELALAHRLIEEVNDD